ncbi:MLP-like protein 165 [Hibiscus syriacus]|uniref:MLP-like protein 165 n=1 Tax=Hibiscus syriacus TaxID=106335 RepID=UPI0019227790|nr:MLP-like protein 165 [Hibiscus syriacus]
MAQTRSIDCQIEVKSSADSFFHDQNSPDAKDINLRRLGKFEKMRMKQTELCVTPKGEGSLVKWTVEYEKQNDDVPKPVKYRDFYTNRSKDVDAYLLNNA